MTDAVVTPLAQRVKNARGWDESTRAIMLAGKQLPVLPEAQRTPGNRIDGCESPVWLEMSENGLFRGYSDSKILRGVLAILIEQANALPVNARSHFDFSAFLSDCGLTRYLSQSRNNGIRFVIEHLRREA